MLGDVSDKERAGPAFLQLAFPWRRGNLLRRSSDETIENQRFHRDSEGPARQRNDLVWAGERIHDASYRARTLVDIARQYAGAGASIKAAEIIDLALKEIVLIQDQSDRADLLAEASIPRTRADIELNPERKLILNKLAGSK